MPRCSNLWEASITQGLWYIMPAAAATTQTHVHGTQRLGCLLMPSQADASSGMGPPWSHHTRLNTAAGLCISPYVGHGGQSHCACMEGISWLLPLLEMMHDVDPCSSFPPSIESCLIPASWHVDMMRRQAKCSARSFDSALLQF